MSAKDLFFVTEMYLDKANYNICLGDSMYAASYQDRIILGSIEFDEKSGKAKFSQKSITIPSSEYVNLINVIDKAYKWFEGDDSVPLPPYETLIYRYSKVHHLYAKYEMWQDEPTFKLVIKWNFANDDGWNRMVANGSKKPIDTSQLLDKQ